MLAGTGRTPQAEVVTAVESAARLMESLGHAVEPTAWPMDGDQFALDFTVLWSTGAAELEAAISDALGRPAGPDDLEPFSLAMAGLVHHLPPGAVDAAVERLNAASRAYDAWLTQYDVILSPVLGKPPVPLGEVAGWVDFPELQARLSTYVGYTPVQNVAGAPAMSVPLHWTADGLPVGVQFGARAGAEKLLLELALQLEAARPWAWRKPAVSL
jgi:amidase